VAVSQTVNVLTRSGYTLSTAQKNSVREGCATSIGTVPSRYRRVSVMLAGASSRGILVPGDHVGGMERLNDVEGAVPAFAAAVGRLGEGLVDVVVDDVARGDQADRGRVQHGGVVGVAVPRLDGDEGMAVDGEAVVRDCLGEQRDRRLGELAGEEAGPQGAGTPPGMDSVIRLIVA
jgi:hypothetical protein